MSALQTQSVRTLFDSIARRYDLLNHLLSGGMDFYWRRRAIEHLRDLHPRHILDVATGTGDFAIATMRLSPTQVVGVDISEEMIDLGLRKVEYLGLRSLIALQIGNAECLPFQTDGFDAAIVAFGARNFENLQRGLIEMHRVIRPGGRIVVLEFSRPRVFLFKQLYFFYFLKILPFVGRAVSKSPDAYKYLSESVMKFPDDDEFLSILREVGFTHLAQERLTLGIVTIYVGTK